MMKRVEFSKKVRAEAFVACEGKCQKCKANLKVGEGEYDHIIPFYFSQDSSLENCQVLCVTCHRGCGGKTSDDQKAISKSKRVSMKHNGSWPKSRFKIKSRSFKSQRG